MGKGEARGDKSRCLIGVGSAPRHKGPVPGHQQKGRVPEQLNYRVRAVKTLCRRLKRHCKRVRETEGSAAQAVDGADDG
jgi:hypothetical protein